MTSGVCVKTQALFIWIFTSITRKLKNLVTKALKTGRSIEMNRRTRRPSLSIRTMPAAQ